MAKTKSQTWIVTVRMDKYHGTGDPRWDYTGKQLEFWVTETGAMQAQQRTLEMCAERGDEITLLDTISWADRLEQWKSKGGES